MSDVILKGVALKAAVAAAEKPITGRLVARNIVAQLELDQLKEIDLREEGDPPMATLPHHLPTPGTEESGDE